MNHKLGKLVILVLAVALALAACAAPAATPTAAPAAPTKAAAPTTQAPAATTQVPAAKPEAAAPGVSADKVKLGYIGDLSGPTAVVQVPFYRGWDTYVKMVNDQGGIAGRKIELIAEDDKYTVPPAQAAYKKLTTQDNVFAIMGLNGSDQISTMLPAIEKDGVPVFGTMNTVTAQIQPFRQWHFTMLASYVDISNVLVDYVLGELKKKGEQPRVAIVVLEVTSGKETADLVEAALQRAGTKAVARVLLPSTVTDAMPQVQQLKSANPNFIIFHASVGPMVALLKSMEKAAYKVPVAMTFTQLSDAMYKSVSPEYGALAVGEHSFMPPESDGAAFDKMRQMAQKYGNQQYATSTYFTQGYTGATVWFEAMNRAGKDLTRESMRKGLESLKNFDTGGLSPPVTYGENDHHGVDGLRMFKYDYDKQKIVAISDWMFPSKQ